MSQYSDLILSRSPVGYWRLGESSGTNATDSGGNGYNGTYTGGFSLSQAGVIFGDANAAVDLDGSSGFVFLGDAIGQAFPLGMSCEAWVKTTSSSASFIFERSEWQEDYAFGLLMDSDGTVVFGHFVDFARSSVSINDGNWHHVLGTISADATPVARIYVDGVLRGSATTRAVTASILNSAIGARPAGLLYFDGIVDEVALYQRPLTLAEIQADYNAGASGQYTDAKASAALFSGFGFGF